MKFMVVPEVAELLRSSRDTVYKLARERDLPSVRVGGKLLFPEDGVREYLAKAAGPKVYREPEPAA